MTAIRIIGSLVVVSLLVPLVFAVRVSLSADSFLTGEGEWSLRWYQAFFNDRRWMAACARSCYVGGGAALLAVLLGTPLAFALTRWHFTGRRLVAGLSLLPLCIPPAVLGMGLLPLLYSIGLWGNPLGLILVHALVALPIIALLVGHRLATTDSDLEAAVRGLGASPWQVVTRITLPLLRPAVLTGAVAAFAISFNESMLTVFLATPSTETLPAVIWPQLRYAASPLVAVASCLGMAVAAAGTVAYVSFRSRLRLRQRLEDRRNRDRRRSDNAGSVPSLGD